MELKNEQKTGIYYTFQYNFFFHFISICFFFCRSECEFTFFFIEFLILLLLLLVFALFFHDHRQAKRVARWYYMTCDLQIQSQIRFSLLRLFYGSIHCTYDKRKGSNTLSVSVDVYFTHFIIVFIIISALWLRPLSLSLRFAILFTLYFKS